MYTRIETKDNLTSLSLSIITFILQLTYIHTYIHTIHTILPSLGNFTQFIN